jgi:hypothetical protein
MAYRSYRTANRHSVQFIVRRFFRRLRLRTLDALVRILDTEGTHARA